MNVAQKEVGGVDEYSIAFFGCDFKSPKSRFSERFFYRESLVLVVRRGAEIVVRSDEQDTWSNSIETHDCAVAELSAIETDVVRTDSGRQ